MTNRLGNPDDVFGGFDQPYHSIFDPEVTLISCPGMLMASRPEENGMNEVYGLDLGPEDEFKRPDPPIDIPIPIDANPNALNQYEETMNNNGKFRVRYTRIASEGCRSWQTDIVKIGVCRWAPFFFHTLIDARKWIKREVPTWYKVVKI